MFNTKYYSKKQDLFTAVKKKSEKKSNFLKDDFKPRNDIKNEYLENDIIYQQSKIETRVVKSKYSNHLDLYSYGVTNKGNSIVNIIKGFKPFFFIEFPETHAYTVEIFGYIKAAIDEDLEKIKKNTKCISIERVDAKNLFFYSEKKKIFIKIFLTDNISNFDLFKRWSDVPVDNTENKSKLLNLLGKKRIEMYESNISPELQFMVKKKITDFKWLKINKFKIEKMKKKSKLQIEIETEEEGLEIIEDIHKIADFMYFVFDIECLNEEMNFPKVTDSIILCISCCIYYQGEENARNKFLIHLGTTEKIESCTTIECENEFQIICTFREIVNHFQPNFFVHFNGNDFDIPFIINKSYLYNEIEWFSEIGALKNQRLYLSESISNDKLTGCKSEVSVRNLSGMINFDVYKNAKSLYKLNSYSLEKIAQTTLGEDYKKDNVSYRQMKDLFYGNNKSRWTLYKYCLKDSELTYLVAFKNAYFENAMKMCEVTRCNSDEIFRGVSIRVLSLIYNFSKTMVGDSVYLLPHLSASFKKNQKPIQGAVVFDPKCGYYDVMVAILDFTSLYPSIIMRWNICYSTILKEDQIPIDWVQDKDYHKIFLPGFKKKIENITIERKDSCIYFLSKERGVGVLPKICKFLLDTRSYYKNLLKKTDSKNFLYKIYDLTQNVYKILANSVYGFTGASYGDLKLSDVAYSITAMGQIITNKTKNIIETYFTKKNGFKYDATVVYGDTDSVMINFGNYKVKHTHEKQIHPDDSDTIKEFEILVKEACKAVSDHFKDPIDLKYEGFLVRSHFVKKKAYGGLHPPPSNKLYMKGVGSVRRENCNFVKKLLEGIWVVLFGTESKEQVAKYLLENIGYLLKGEIPMSDLILNIKIKQHDEYKNPDSNFRVQYAKKIEKKGKRAFGQAMKAVLVLEDYDKKAKKSDFTDDPLFVHIYDKNIYYYGYYKKHLEKVLFESILPTLFDSEDLNSLRDKINHLPRFNRVKIHKPKLYFKNNLSLEDYDEQNNIFQKLKDYINEKIFESDMSVLHIYIDLMNDTQIVVKFDKNTSLLKFKSFIKQRKGLFYGGFLFFDEIILTVKIKGNSKIENYFRKKNIFKEKIFSELIELDEARKEYKEICAMCQINNGTKIVCNNEDCTIYYERSDIQRDYESKYLDFYTFK